MYDKNFLYSLLQLCQRNMTKGYKCFPICVSCYGKGKKVTKDNKKNAIQACIEREAIAAGSDKNN